jgi:hypothetical protein
VATRANDLRSFIFRMDAWFHNSSRRKNV